LPPTRFHCFPALHGKTQRLKASSANQKVGTEIFIYLCAGKIVKEILISGSLSCPENADFL
jgi:hypothetical protein